MNFRETRSGRTAPVGPLELHTEIGAIDVGETHACVALPAADRGICLVPSPSGFLQSPATIDLSPDGSYRVARSSGSSTLSRFREAMQTGEHYRVQGHTLDAMAATGLFIESLLQNVREFSGQPMTEAVISASGGLSMAQTAYWTDAFHRAGVGVARVLRDATASALCLTRMPVWEDRDARVALVVHLGRRSLDVAVCGFGDGVIECMATSHQDELGSEAYDAALTDVLLSKLMDQREDPTREDVRSDLMVEAARARTTLRLEPEASLVLPHFWETLTGSRHARIGVDRDAYGEFTQKLSHSLRRCSHHTIERSSRAPEEIDTVLLCGEAPGSLESAMSFEISVQKPGSSIGFGKPP